MNELVLMLGILGLMWNSGGSSRGRRETDKGQLLVDGKRRPDRKIVGSLPRLLSHTPEGSRVVFADISANAERVASMRSHYDAVGKPQIGELVLAVATNTVCR